MTTLWARMLVFEEYRKGRITEKCAQYFDAILDNAEKSLVSRNKNLSNRLNGANEDCVLGELGAVHYKTNDGEYTRFDVMKYIRATTFTDGSIKTGSNETAYLANIIGQDYVGLDGEIIALIKSVDPNVQKSTLISIKKYLESTYDETARKDVSRLSECILKTICRNLQMIDSEKTF